MIETESPDEIWKAKAEYERERFRVTDSRITNFDNQVGVLIAAALAVLGFSGASSANRDEPTWLLLVLVAAAMITTLLALSSREDLPRMRLPGLYGTMKEKEKQAEEARGALDSQDFASLGEAYSTIYMAFKMGSDLMDARRSLKFALYVLAVVALFVELVLVLFLMTFVGVEPISK